MAEDKEYEVVGRKKKRLNTSKKVLVGLLLLGTAGIGGWSYYNELNQKRKIETSAVEEFQKPDTNTPFAKIDTPPEREPEPKFDFGPIENRLNENQTALEARNAQLQAQVRQLQEQLGALSREAEQGQSQLLQKLTAAVEESQRQNIETLKQLRRQISNDLDKMRLETEKRLGEEQRARETFNEQIGSQLEAQAMTVTQLQREYQALQQQIQGGMNEAMLAQQEAERQAQEEARRRARLEKLREEQHQAMQERIKSPAVVFDEKAATAAAGAATADAAASGGPAGPRSRDERGRDFVTASLKPVEVTQAEVIANPSNTIIQGTIIGATLENGIDSSLPGQISAIINEPVWSFDQSRILIPAGSRAFGNYSSDVSLGQGRVLVSWNRIVTPEGQSVELSGFGGDPSGRSGIRGQVHSRFGMRFGSAALISLIGAAPSIAANSVDNEVQRNTLTEVGNDLTDATNTVIGEYASLPPIIVVDPGASITIMVDRDLELY